MNKAVLGVGIILLAIIAFATINLVQNFSTGQELDYYLLKETADAAMSDALDYGFYANSGSVRMDKEKFVESFLLRFANDVSDAKAYDISFYDINETPPKASIRIDAATTVNGQNGAEDNIAITTTYDSLVESKYEVDPATEYLILNKKLTAKQKAE